MYEILDIFSIFSQFLQGVCNISADSAGNSDEFSSSNSREEGSDPSGATPAAQSREEMGAILSKIRQYIRSRPKNYSKLKKNLADWMLIDNSTSPTPSEEVTEDSTNSTDPSPSHLAPVEHGKLLRRRRGTPAELRKLSESGENGAFEEIDPILEATTKKADALGGSIWSREHGDEHGILADPFDPHDGSNSESESSWSSSEEAMAKCTGVLGNFRLVANDSCALERAWNSEDEPFYSGVVSSSGYYYFIFGSENEKRDNIIRIRFEMEKFVYHLPPPVANCSGVRQCAVNFTFASNEKVTG